MNKKIDIELLVSIGVVMVAFGVAIVLKYEWLNLSMFVLIPSILIYRKQKMKSIQSITESLILNSLLADYQFVRQGVLSAKKLEALLGSAGNSREQVMQKLRTELDSNDKFFGVWTVREPNSFDNKDSQIGRFSTYFYRQDVENKHNTYKIKGIEYISACIRIKDKHKSSSNHIYLKGYISCSMTMSFCPFILIPNKLMPLF